MTSPFLARLDEAIDLLHRLAQDMVDGMAFENDTDAMVIDRMAGALIILGDAYALLEEGRL